MSSSRYRTIVQYPRAGQRINGRYTPYQKRTGRYQRQAGKTTYTGLTRTGRRFFRRAVAKELERAAESKYYEDIEYFDWEGNILPRLIYREGERISFCGNIAPGTGNYGNRIGNRITITSIQLRLVISPYDSNLGDRSSTIITTFILRIIIFTWRDDSEPQLADILSPPTSVALFNEIFYNVMSPLNVDKKVKRKILYDETTTHYNNYDGKNSVDTVCYKNIYIPIKKFRQVYYSNEDEPEQIGVNKIYAWLFSNVTNPDYSQPNMRESWPVYCYWRINYKDI